MALDINKLGTVGKTAFATFAMLLALGVGSNALAQEIESDCKSDKFPFKVSSKPGYNANGGPFNLAKGDRVTFNASPDYNFRVRDFHRYYTGLHCKENCQGFTHTMEEDETNKVYQLESNGEPLNYTITCDNTPEVDPKKLADGLDKVTKSVFNYVGTDAGTLAQQALNGQLGLTNDMTVVDTRSAAEKDFAAQSGAGKVANKLENQLNLMGNVDNDEFAIGFEQKLGS